MSISRRIFLETAAAVGLTAAAGAALIVKPAAAMGSSDEAAGQTATDAVNNDALAENPNLPDMVLGDPDAPVTVIEYASLTCSHCATFHNETFPKVKEQYIDTGKIRFVQRMYPLDNRALSAAMVARCAGDKLYYPLLETFYERQRQWAFIETPGPEIFNIARQAGFTQESFEACLTNQELYDAILAQKNAAFEQLGVESTPTFFINGKKVSGALTIEAFAQEVDPLLAD